MMYVIECWLLGALIVAFAFAVVWVIIHHAGSFVKNFCTAGGVFILFAAAFAVSSIFIEGVTHGIYEVGKWAADLT